MIRNQQPSSAPFVRPRRDRERGPFAVHLREPVAKRRLPRRVVRRGRIGQTRSGARDVNGDEFGLLGVATGSDHETRCVRLAGLPFERYGDQGLQHQIGDERVEHVVVDAQIHVQRAESRSFQLEGRLQQLDLLVQRHLACGSAAERSPHDPAQLRDGIFGAVRSDANEVLDGLERFNYETRAQLRLQRTQLGVQALSRRFTQLGSEPNGSRLGALRVAHVHDGVDARDPRRVHGEGDEEILQRGVVSVRGVRSQGVEDEAKECDRKPDDHAGDRVNAEGGAEAATTDPMSLREPKADRERREHARRGDDRPRARQPPSDVGMLHDV